MAWSSGSSPWGFGSAGEGRLARDMDGGHDLPFDGERARRVSRCATLVSMAAGSNRVNIVLDDARALKLRRLAERTNTNPGTIARSLLSTALDDADPDPRTITALLDGIDGAWEDATAGRAEVRSGLGIPLDDI